MVKYIPVKLKRNVIVNENAISTSEIMIITKGRVQTSEIPRRAYYIDDFKLINAEQFKLKYGDPFEDIELEFKPDKREFIKSEKKLAKFINDIEVPLKLINDYADGILGFFE